MKSTWWPRLVIVKSRPHRCGCSNRPARFEREERPLAKMLPVLRLASVALLLLSVIGSFPAELVASILHRAEGR